MRAVALPVPESMISNHECYWDFHINKSTVSISNMVCWVLPLPVRPGIIQTCNKFVNGETEHTGEK